MIQKHIPGLYNLQLKRIFFELVSTVLEGAFVFEGLIISNTMTLGKLVIKCPRKPRENLLKFTNPPEA